jgi:PTH2 family peptidyl-tRNA hydrolase
MSQQEVKQWIIVRKDLGMRKGKMIAQGAHASLAAVLQRGNPSVSKNKSSLTVPCDKDLAAWIEGRFTKVALGVESGRELHELAAHARRLGLRYALIQDAGVTEFNGEPTYTALAIGPCQVSDGQKVVGHLKLL